MLARGTDPFAISNVTLWDTWWPKWCASYDWHIFRGWRIHPYVQRPGGKHKCIKSCMVVMELREVFIGEETVHILSRHCRVWVWGGVRIELTAWALGFPGLLHEWHEWPYELFGAQIARQMLLAQRSLALMLWFSAMPWVATAAPKGLWRELEICTEPANHTHRADRVWGALHQPKWVTVLQGKKRGKSALHAEDHPVSAGVKTKCRPVPQGASGPWQGEQAAAGTQVWGRSTAPYRGCIQQTPPAMCLHRWDFSRNLEIWIFYMKSPQSWLRLFFLLVLHRPNKHTCGFSRAHRDQRLANSGLLVS